MWDSQRKRNHILKKKQPRHECGEAGWAEIFDWYAKLWYQMMWCESFKLDEMRSSELAKTGFQRRGIGRERERARLSRR